MPEVNISAADSPTSRPMPRMTAVRMPGMAQGSTMLRITRSLPAPRAKAPSL